MERTANLFLAWLAAHRLTAAAGLLCAFLGVLIFWLYGLPGEAIAYLILFFIMIYLYKNYSKKLHRGFFFGLCLAYIFTFRFFIEFVKQNQEAFEDNMMFNMGQWLSIPFVIVGIYFMFFYDRKKKVA